MLKIKNFEYIEIKNLKNSILRDFQAFIIFKAYLKVNQKLSLRIRDLKLCEDFATARNVPKFLRKLLSQEIGTYIEIKFSV